MKNYTILIVEDEVIIGELLARYLRESGYRVVGIAGDYEEAKQLYLRYEPDLVLLDVRLRGYRNGIDFARFLQESESPPPFIFLTSQTDAATIDAVTDTLPAGYLTKPVRPKELLASVVLALRRSERKQKATGKSLTVSDGDRDLTVPLKEVLYFESDHVYVRVHTKNGKAYLMRKSLASLAKELPKRSFFRVHRGYIINREWVKKMTDQYVVLNDRRVPVSRSRRREVVEWLAAEREIV